MAAQTKIIYPESRVDEQAYLENTVEKVKNEYAWLENPDSEETGQWVGEQNKLFDEYLGELRSRGELGKISETYKSLLNYERRGPPSHHGKHFHYYKNDGLQNQSVLYSLPEGLAGPSSVYLDPNSLAEDGTASLGSTAFSEDGEYFAYGVQRQGSDWQTIHVLRSHDLLTLPLDQCEFVKFSSISWTHDAKGFFYARFPDPGTSALGTETSKNEFHALYYHRLGTSQAEDVLIYQRLDHSQWLFGSSVTEDGDYLLITTFCSCEDLNQVHILPLKEKNIDVYIAASDNPLSVLETISPHLIPLITTFEASFSLLTNEGTTFWFQSNLNAPRGSMLSVDISKPELRDHPTDWTVILPHHPTDVLTSATVVNKSVLVAMYMKDVTDRIFLFDLHGQAKGEVALPALGALSGLTAKKEDNFFFFKFVSFTHPGTICKVEFDESGDFTTSTYFETTVQGVTPSDFVVAQEWYASKDGTKVPMFIVSHKSVPRDSGNAPVLLYGYGGFNISIQPSFSSFWVFFLQYFRGILAVANIRGGGEFGEDWHHGGVKSKKQNAFDDFCAAAEYLVTTNATQPSLITINGASNGGLLVGACITQRPELFGCAIAQVGVLDMLQFHKFTIGYHWTSDYGCADDPEDFKYLIQYSPLHNVRIHESQYPAVLLVTGDHDDRVVPLHTLKFGAKLQAVVGADPKQTNPLLLRIECKAGHGAGKPISKTIIENSEIFAFIAKSLNLQLFGLLTNESK